MIITKSKTMARKLSIANKAWAVSEAACNVDWDKLDAEQIADKVIELLGGDRDVFLQIDERPRQHCSHDFNNYAFCYFRQTRNHPIHGKRLFASFKR